MDGFEFDLQAFAEGEAAGAKGGDTGTGTSENGKRAEGGKKGEGQDSTSGDDGKKSYTQEELEAALGEKLTAKLAAEKKRWEKEYQTKWEAAKKEQERLSKLSDDERKKAELDAAQVKLAEKERELKIKELKLEVVEDLTKRNIPVSFLDYLVDTDSEKTLARITNFEKEYKKAIDAAVTERLKGKTPKAGDKGSSEVGVSRAKSGFLGDLKSMQARKY